ncbi:MAG TPA: DUF58 domain-containing protein [Trueperaceae bacterium]|nr:DUF58 domain-containing protein [Trueperaceae bacterium]
MNASLTRDVRRLVGASKLIALRAPANTALGDRRSRSVGSGIEFAQYRDYEPGDDLRHLDRHVYARFGRTTIKQFHLEQRLRVSVLLDASGSMGVDPSSWQRAVELASALGTAALNGSDQVRFGSAKGGHIEWGTVVTREAQLWRAVSHLEATRPGGGNGTFSDAAARSLEALTHPGLLVVIGDWLVDDYQAALKTWHVRGQEIVAIQVLGRAESDAAGDSSGWLRLVDAETGAVEDRSADATTWSSYRAAVAEWSERVRASVWAVEGRWLSVPAGGRFDEMTVRSMRGLGLIT